MISGIEKGGMRWQTDEREEKQTARGDREANGGCD